jgi:hypothetical protein
MNASRKKDREQIARNFIAIADRCGATVERRDFPRSAGYSGAGIDLAFKLNGVAAQLSISDFHDGDRGLISWYNDYLERGATRYFTPAFNAATDAIQDMTYLHHKATSYGSWTRLEILLLGGLSHAAAGTAFLAEDTPT